MQGPLYNIFGDTVLHVSVWPQTNDMRVIKSHVPTHSKTYIQKGSLGIKENVTDPYTDGSNSFM